MSGQDARPVVFSMAGIVIAICAAIGLHDLCRPIPAPSPVTISQVHLDSSTVTAAIDTQRIRDSIGLVVRDSLRHTFRSAPIREVIRWLPAGDTIRDTIKTPVPDATIRATADSLATCHQQRDSLTGAVTISQASDSLHRAALDSANRRTCPAAQPVLEPPSRALWATAGALVTVAIEATILFLTR